MIFSSEGVLRGEDGAELAHVEDRPGPANALLTVGETEYEIVLEGVVRTRFRLIDTASRTVYEFHPGLRRGGIVALPDGAPAAQLVKPWLRRGWRVVPESREQILVKRDQGLLGPAISKDGRFVPPALQIDLPVSTAPDGELRRLLAFSCWLIAGWECEIRRLPL